MNFMWGRRPAEEADEAMARAKRDLNTALIERYVELLKACGTSRDAFDAAYAELGDDAELKSAELIAVAKAYAGASQKISSKKAALDAIRKRFVEHVRNAAKSELAAGSRPW